MEKIYLSKINEVFIKINCSVSQSLELKEYFSCYAPNYKFNPRYRNRIWDGKISFFDYKEKTIPIGLLPKFDMFCKTFEYDYGFNFDVKELTDDITNKEISDFTNILAEKRNSQYLPRDYQLKAIVTALKSKRGVIESSVGSGKSFMIYNVITFLMLMNKKVILVVPSVSLVEQMYSDFKEYGWDDIEESCSKLYSGQNYDKNKKLLITTYQSIAKKGENFFESYGALINDECHNAKSISIQTIAKKCINSDYRLGFTGTLPDDTCDKLNIYGYLGPKLYSLKSSELINKGVLSKISIANILIKYPKDIMKIYKRCDYNEEVKLVKTYEPRNKVFTEIFKYIKDGENTMILCSLRDHLESIKRYIEENFDKKYVVYIMHGDVKPSVREDIRKRVNNEENVILLCTFGVASTGLNVKRINNVVFASSYKSKIKVLQSIGRGLRTHETKKEKGMILFDIVDDLTYETRTGSIYKNHLYRHFEERLKYYQDQKFKYYNKIFEI